LTEKSALAVAWQDIAKDRQVRVTFISGDVHLASVGRLYSYPKMKDEDFREDFRYMANITSSAMGNEAPPDGLLKTYEMINFSQDLNLGVSAQPCTLLVDLQLLGAVHLPAHCLVTAGDALLLFPLWPMQMPVDLL
jgi:hypothetical protein